MPGGKGEKAVGCRLTVRACRASWALGRRGGILEEERKRQSGGAGPWRKYVYEREKSPEPAPKKKLVVMVKGRLRKPTWRVALVEKCPY